MLLIALPLTPNKALWGAVLNPYVILKLLTLILAVQALAHIAKRLLSSKNAMLLSSLASGFVSSTATIASLGLEVRNGRAEAKANAGGSINVLRGNPTTTHDYCDWYQYYLVQTHCTALPNRYRDTNHFCLMVYASHTTD